MPNLKVFLLGPPALELDGQPVEIKRRKALALLAYLAVTGRAHTRDEVATLFWPDYEPAGSYAYLRRAIWELNNTLGKGWLEAGREQIGLSRGAAFWLDVSAFQEGVKPGRHEPADPLDRLATAAALYRGDFMAGFTLRDAPEFDMWQRFTAEQLQQQLSLALERLVIGYEGRGDFEPALEYAQRWLTLDALHEPAHQALMRLYAASGRRAAAVRQYESCVAILEAELGLTPEADTTVLYDQILQGAWPAGAAREPAAGIDKASTRLAPEREIVRLPVQPTPFVGRKEETEAISNLLAEPSCRLLSLTGPGGSGKTRLAIRVAEQLVERESPAAADGAYFVSLAPLVSPDSIGPAIGKSLGGDFYREGQEPRRQLINYLRQKRLLLILDNFEHLLGKEAIAFLGDLLAELNELKVLVTSRTRLNIRGERLFPVAGMRAPADGRVDGRPAGEAQLSLTEAQSYSSLRLFVQSARQVSPNFELTPENLPAVVTICQSVQGMPLAIELAAGWIELLRPSEISAEIERSLDILETELQDVPDRQRSIRAVFESSWQLLDAQERNIMARLSVFRGGFERLAAEQVSGATLRILLSLSSKSWLQREAAGRFQLHELLRQYAGEQLQAEPGDWQRANDQHAAFYAELLNTAGQKMKGPDQLSAIEQVAAEFDNISVAWGWYVEQGRITMLIRQMLPGLYRYSYTRSTEEELLSLIRAASSALDPAPKESLDSDESAILLVYEILTRMQMTYWLSYRDSTLRAWAYVEQSGGFNHYDHWLVLLAIAYAWQVDREEGARWLAWLADEAQQTGEQWGSAVANLELADVVQADGHYVRALKAAKRARRVFQKLGDIGMQAHTLRRLGSLLWSMGEYDQAEQLLLAGRDLFRATADRAGESVIVQELHEMCLMAGEFERAFKYFAERREIARALDQRHLVHESLHWESMQAVRFGDPDHARALRLESLELARALNDPVLLAWDTWEMGELLRVEGDLIGARQWYGDALDHFQKTEQLLGIAFYNRGLGDIALANGDYEEALQRFELCLHLAETEDHMWGMAYALSGLGRVEVALANLERAEQQFRRAFQQAYIVSRDLFMLPLYGLGTWMAASGEPDRALELAAFVANYHLSWHETRRLACALIDEMSDRVSKADAEMAVERGRARDLDSVIVEFGLEVKDAADG